jgi:hypothetical protein
MATTVLGVILQLRHDEIVERLAGDASWPKIMKRNKETKVKESVPNLKANMVKGWIKANMVGELSAETLAEYETIARRNHTASLKGRAGTNKRRRCDRELIVQKGWEFVAANATHTEYWVNKGLGIGTNKLPFLLTKDGLPERGICMKRVAKKGKAMVVPPGVAEEEEDEEEAEEAEEAEEFSEDEDDM